MAFSEIKTSGATKTSVDATGFANIRNDIENLQEFAQEVDVRIGAVGGGAGGSPAITSGGGAPSSTPGKVGDIYVDTTGDNAYIAVGTGSSSDWELSNDGVGSGGGSTVSSGSGSPSTTPSSVGDIYIDLAGDDAYTAVGTASSADWEKNNDGAGGAVLDEDSFATDSATQPPSQQSTKAYIQSKIGLSTPVLVTLNANLTVNAAHAGRTAYLSADDSTKPQINIQDQASEAYGAGFYLKLTDESDSDSNHRMQIRCSGVARLYKDRYDGGAGLTVVECSKSGGHMSLHKRADDIWIVEGDMA